MINTDREAAHYAFLPVPCTLVPVKPKYLPQYLVLVYKDEFGISKSAHHGKL